MVQCKIHVAVQHKKPYISTIDSFEPHTHCFKEIAHGQEPRRRTRSRRRKDG